MQHNAFVFRSASAWHTAGMASSFQSPSHVLAEQAALGSLSGPEDRAAAADHALWIYRRAHDGAVRGIRGARVRRGGHPGLALDHPGSAASLPGVPALAHRPGSHRHSVADISGMVWHRIDVLTGAWAVAYFRDVVR